MAEIKYDPPHIQMSPEELLLDEGWADLTPSVMETFPITANKDVVDAEKMKQLPQLKANAIARREQRLQQQTNTNPNGLNPVYEQYGDEETDNSEDMEGSEEGSEEGQVYERVGVPVNFDRENNIPMNEKEMRNVHYHEYASMHGGMSASQFHSHSMPNEYLQEKVDEINNLLHTKDFLISGKKDAEWTVNDGAQALNTELGRLRAEVRMHNNVKHLETFLILGCSILQKLNSYIGLLELEGWSKHVKANMQDFRPILEKIFKQHFKDGNIFDNVWVELAYAIGTSAIVYSSNGGAKGDDQRNGANVGTHNAPENEFREFKASEFQAQMNDSDTDSDSDDSDDSDDSIPAPSMQFANDRTRRRKGRQKEQQGGGVANFLGSLIGGFVN